MLIHQGVIVATRHTFKNKNDYCLKNKIITYFMSK